MIVLAMDTSTRTGSVAVVGENRLIAEYNLNISETHASRLMLMIDEVLKDAHLTITKMDAIAVGLGPGSFTGLRIGIATAKGLAIALNKPIAGIPTLDALAHSLSCTSGLICPILDAKRGEIYAALYRCHGHILQKLTGDLVLPMKELLSRINAQVTFLGDAIDIYGGRELVKIVQGEISPENRSMANAILSRLLRRELMRDDDPVRSELIDRSDFCRKDGYILIDKKFITTGFPASLRRRLLIYDFKTGEVKPVLENVQIDLSKPVAVLMDSKLVRSRFGIDKDKYLKPGQSMAGFSNAFYVPSDKLDFTEILRVGIDILEHDGDIEQMDGSTKALLSEILHILSTTTPHFVPLSDKISNDLKETERLMREILSKA